jgi:iron(III) transport system ATP-binding protein
MIETEQGVFDAAADFASTDEVLVYIRPRDIEILPDATAGALSGQIETRIYFGETEELLIRLDGSEQRLRVRTDHHVPESAHSVFLRINWSRVLVFAK